MDQLRLLDQPFTADEIKMVAFQIGPLKRPSIDGKPSVFYQKFQHIVGELATAASLHFLNSGFLLKELNKTLVALIPKKDYPKTVSHYRPISLCNVSYKIISRAIVNRLRPIMDSIVIPFQLEFIRGRLISNNIILGSELFNTIRKKNEGKEFQEL